MGRRLVLSPEQGEAFRRDGFLLYGQLLSQSEVEELRRQVEAIADGEYPYPSELIRFQPQSATGHLQDVPRHDRLYQIRYPHRHHPAFLEHARNANILDVVEELMGPDIVLYNTQVIFKPPFYGADVPWHQDSAYWPIDPPDLVPAGLHWKRLQCRTDACGSSPRVTGRGWLSIGNVESCLTPVEVRQAQLCRLRSTSRRSSTLPCRLGIAHSTTA